ncbi:ribosome biogenesis GTPase Der [bacterium]|nr:ribosome biogenesis GTPase Der [bacterium]MCP5462376.1 ribosome biogenesis GTPase Der [bacterium]
MDSVPKVVIVGRPNVGKSSLFNRLAGMRKAIVDPQSGVTRDRVYADMNWFNYHFTLIDTGGINFDTQCHISQLILQQVQFGLKEADVIVFLVDGKEGLNPYDQDVRKFLRDFTKPVILGVNKIDQYEQSYVIGDFYKLGFERIFPVSANHGLGIEDLLDEITRNLPLVGPKEASYDKITIVGKPNVGKSTLLNAILNEDRAMVDSVAGTTRDIIDTKVTIHNTEYILVDTAGIRHRKKIDDTVESYALLRTEDAIKRSDLVFVLIDATEGVTRQDDRILKMVMEHGKAMLLVFNKWDLVSEVSQNELISHVEKTYKFLSYIPIVCLSALHRTNLHLIYKQIPQLLESSALNIKTSELNRLVSDAMMAKPPSAIRGKRLKIFYSVQTGTRPPEITFFVNNPKLFGDQYKKYILNKIRNRFKFTGSPITTKVKGRAESPEQ